MRSPRESRDSKESKESKEFKEFKELKELKELRDVPGLKSPAIAAVAETPANTRQRARRCSRWQPDRSPTPITLTSSARRSEPRPPLSPDLEASTDEQTEASQGPSAKPLSASPRLGLSSPSPGVSSVPSPTVVYGAHPGVASGVASGSIFRFDGRSVGRCGEKTGLYASGPPSDFQIEPVRTGGRKAFPHGDQSLCGNRRGQSHWGQGHNDYVGNTDGYHTHRSHPQPHTQSQPQQQAWMWIRTPCGRRGQGSFVGGYEGPLDDEGLGLFRTELCREMAVNNMCGLATNCTSSHCISWSRRNPFLHPYRPMLCPNTRFWTESKKMKVKTWCRRGRSCLFAHTKEEQMYHPLVYKSQVCRDWPDCLKPFCPFAHGLTELRDPDAVIVPIPEGPEQLDNLYPFIHTHPQSHTHTHTHTRHGYPPQQIRDMSLEDKQKLDFDKKSKEQNAILDAQLALAARIDDLLRLRGDDRLLTFLLPERVRKRVCALGPETDGEKKGSRVEGRHGKREDPGEERQEREEEEEGNARLLVGHLSPGCIGTVRQCHEMCLAGSTYPPGSFSRSSHSGSDDHHSFAQVLFDACVAIPLDRIPVHG